jgi:pimeloyl-ACP methyl ester carboxylesterase
MRPQDLHRPRRHPISYLTEGAGPPLLLLHGFVSSAQSWWKIGAAQRLAETHTILAPDIRGHGQSGKPTDPAAYGRTLLSDLTPPPRPRGSRDGGRHRLLHGRRACACARRLPPARVRSLTLSGSGWSPHDIVDEYRKWFDVLAAKSDTPVALKALIESVHAFTGLPAETIAALPMPLSVSSARSTTNAPTWSASPRSAPISAR